MCLRSSAVNKGFPVGRASGLVAICVLGLLAGGWLVVSTLLGAQEGTIRLNAPGLRLKKDPLQVIPGTSSYANRPFSLPHYRDAAGNPAMGWSRKYIATRRFKSDQSAWIYYRRQDLDHCIILENSRYNGVICIWPGGSLIVIESYQADLPSGPGQAPVEIAAIAKDEQNTPPYGNAFFPAQWSYALFTSQVGRSISEAKVRECHQCHSIAFQLTGDLVFTRFP